MHAVTRAGGTPKARINLAVAGMVLASGIRPAVAQDAASADKKASVDQLEQLLREQQGLQMRQTQQLQLIRQQMDEHERTNAVQDWQWVGSAALILLLAFGGMWLASQWSTAVARAGSSPWARWQQARLARQQQRQTRREQAATERLMRFQSSPDQTAALPPEAMGSGGEIDHSGPGALGHVLRKTKLRRALKRSRRQEEKQRKDPLGAVLSDESSGQGWLAVLDEPDSQWLADEAVREFELRRAVGLQPEPELPPASAKAAERQHAIDTESAWQAMQEIALTDAPPEPVSSVVGRDARAGSGATIEAGVDVSLEVQRVRSGLRARREQREQRNMGALPALEPVVESIVKPIVEPMAEPVLERVSESAAPVSPMSFATAPSLAVQTADAPSADASAQQIPASFASLGAGSPAQDAGFSISSLPSQTEAETRLALGYEFQKLGQLDEAALLYEEVLAMGSGMDQSRARQLLKALPGR